MAKWNKLTLTKSGSQLLAKAQSGEAATITHIELGDGVLAGSAALEGMTALVNTKQVLTIGEYEVLNDGKIRINSAITNEGLRNGYYMRELGVFAKGKSGIPILFMVATDSSPDFLSVEEDGLITQEFDIYVTTSGASNINVETSAANIVTFGNLKVEVKKAMAGISFEIDENDNGLNFVYDCEDDEE